MLGESVVAVAAGTAGTSWRLESSAGAILGFAALACVWWLYFDRQANVVLRGTTLSVVVYSYTHLPLLMGLAAASAGLRLLIERAGEDQLGVGASAALLGGVLVYLVSLVVTRSVTVSGPRGIGVSLKLGAGAISRPAPRRTVAAAGRTRGCARLRSGGDGLHGTRVDLAAEGCRRHYIGVT